MIYKYIKNTYRYFILNFLIFYDKNYYNIFHINPLIKVLIEFVRTYRLEIKGYILNLWDVRGRWRRAWCIFIRNLSNGNFIILILVSRIGMNSDKIDLKVILHDYKIIGDSNKSIVQKKMGYVLGQHNILMNGRLKKKRKKWCDLGRYINKVRPLKIYSLVSSGVLSR